jgi:DNA helicase IV
MEKEIKEIVSLLDKTDLITERPFNEIKLLHKKNLRSVQCTGTPENVKEIDELVSSWDFKRVLSLTSISISLTSIFLISFFVKHICFSFVVLYEISVNVKYKNFLKRPKRKILFSNIITILNILMYIKITRIRWTPNIFIRKKETRRLRLWKMSVGLY